MRTLPEYKDGRCKDITFIVTKDCQLACKYCYLVGKNSGERMSWETAKRVVDFILSQEHDELFDFEAVVFNFIGGEPFLEIDLIDRICDYLKIQMYLKNHHWFNSYRFSITTNGLNYDSPKVQNFIRKNVKHLNITITIDGTSRKHDLNRVWRNNGLKGSYDTVVKNIPLWLEQFPDAATKVTISSPDIPYISESVLHLFSLGIHNVHINCVFENVWQEGDDVLFEQQLRSLADSILDKQLYEDYDCTLFELGIGRPMDPVHENRNWCGAGLMLAADANGNFYPCTRFAKYALREKAARMIGNVNEGINKNIVRPYYSLSRTLQSTKECIECDVASGCAWCQGENYDCADSPTIFQRSTAICKMHKARVRANNYFWSQLEKLNRSDFVRRPVRLDVDNRCTLDKNTDKLDALIVLLATDSTPFCISDSVDEHILMDLNMLESAIRLAIQNDWELHFVYPAYELPEGYLSIIENVSHKKSILPCSLGINGDAIVINKWEDINELSCAHSFYILRTTLADFYQNVESLRVILRKAERLNIVFKDEESFSVEDEVPYKDALEKLSWLVRDNWEDSRFVQVNLLTDRLQYAEMDNCDAGWKTVTLAPNGNFYICPSFYYNNADDSCGNLTDGLKIKNPLLYKLDHSPLCATCNAYHCARCVFLNKQKTLEVNIPSYEQCKKAEIEMEVTLSFFEKWQKRDCI